MTELRDEDADIVAEAIHNGAVKVVKNVYGRTGMMGGFEYARLRIDYPNARVVERRFNRIDLFVLLPSARGVHPQTFWNMDVMRSYIEAAGHKREGNSVHRMPLDAVRNELHLAYLMTPCHQALLLDDDVQIVPPQWIVKMMEAMATGEVDVISAPCRMRHHGGEGAQGLFNILPKPGDTIQVGELRLLELTWTGLGAVLVSRKAMQALYDASEKYASWLMQPNKAAAIYRSEIVLQRYYDPSHPEDANVYILDDKVFSKKLCDLGFKIFAAIDVPTVHDGMQGCFADDLEFMNRARARQQAEEAKKKPSLLGPDGRKLG